MTRFSPKIRQQIRRRAKERCEYCGLPDVFSFHPFQVDHILASKHGGMDTVDNLAWACVDCNNAKGSDVGSYDPETGIMVAFYNPRKQAWSDHFEMREGMITGKTPSGRVTVRILQMNRFEQVETRRLLAEAGLWSEI